MPTARRAQSPASDEGADAGKPLCTLKKYPNRRLYDTQTSS